MCMNVKKQNVASIHRLRSSIVPPAAQVHVVYNKLKRLQLPYAALLIEFQSVANRSLSLSLPPTFSLVFRHRVLIHLVNVYKHRMIVCLAVELPHKYYRQRQTKKYSFNSCVVLVLINFAFECLWILPTTQIKMFKCFFFTLSCVLITHSFQFAYLAEVSVYMYTLY